MVRRILHNKVNKPIVEARQHNAHFASYSPLELECGITVLQIGIKGFRLTEVAALLSSEK